ncbi:TPA: integrase, partial [Candidatus Poribacteria bacterium]|nr:integrase [Candidatus Poribacteria bacterium]
LELEFLSYVEQIRNANHKKLFPNLKKMLSTGYGTLISRWFARYLKKLGIKKRGKNFHSFRHTVVNKLITKKVYEPFIKELIGHSHGSITMDVYGGKKPLYVLLNECVIKI